MDGQAGSVLWTSGAAPPDPSDKNVLRLNLNKNVVPDGLFSTFEFLSCLVWSRHVAAAAGLVGRSFVFR